MPPFTFPFWRSNVIEEESSEEDVGGTHPQKDDNMTEVKQINWLTNPISGCRKSLEHSFSDISQFNLSSTHPTSDTTLTQQGIKGLRADFAHLYGVSVGSPTNNSPAVHSPEEKEGFHFRSIQRSVSSIEFISSDKSLAKDNQKVIVVVPSLDLDEKELKRMCTSLHCYEERQLYYLLMMNDPSLRIIYLTSEPVDEKVVGYYLGLSRNDENSGQHDIVDQFSDVHNKLTRIFMVNVPSKAYIPLSDKIVQDSNLVKFLKGLIHERNASASIDLAGLCVCTGSESISKLSHELSIKLLEASESHLHFGTKQGSRQIFAACGIPHPAGTPSADDNDLLAYGNRHGYDAPSWALNYRYIRSSHALAIGLSRRILIDGVHPRKWMVKLNQGFSGKGNASINLQNLQGCRSSNEEVCEKDILDLAAKIEKEFETMHFEDPAMTWHGDDLHVGFKKQIERLGVIAESFIEGEVPTSPSIQAVIEPSGNENCRVSIVSTHEQLLDGQVFQGCINPASEQYRPQIMEMGLKAGKYLASQGVTGHFSCDFLATQNKDGSCDINAVEINLRQGGCTHPQATMALLCGGCVCSDGVFRNNDNEVRCYVATDNEKIKPCSESHLIDAIECKTDPLASKIRWNKVEHVGVVFHLFKFANVGRIGYTCIGRNSSEAQYLFDSTKEFLSQLS